MDLNGDGLEDFLLHSPRNESNEDPNGLFRIFINEAGVLIDRTDQLLIGSLNHFTMPRQYLFADFNGDGSLDIFLDSHGLEISQPFPGEQNELILSNGDGTWSVTEGNLPALTDFSHGSSIGDLDSDGDIDILVNNLGGQDELFDERGFPVSYYVLINDGSGVFTRNIELLAHLCSETVYGSDFDPGHCSHFWTQVIDANGDGHMDLYLGEDYDYDGGPPDQRLGFIVLNNGDGSFGLPVPNSLPESLNGGRGVPQDVFVLDINNDGLDDLLAEDTDLFNETPVNENQWNVLISNGDGTFRDETALRIPYVQPSLRERLYVEIQVVDFDEDGFRDIIFQRHPPDYDGTQELWLTVFLNDGEGFFRELPRSDFPFAPTIKFTGIDLRADDNGLDFIDYNFFEETEATVIRSIRGYGPNFEGDSGSDRLVGGARDEQFEGAGGDDELLGGAGNDSLLGGAGNDSLRGEGGRDTLRGDAGSDEIDGGAGADYAVFALGAGNYQVSGDVESATVTEITSGDSDSLTNIEYLNFSDSEIYLADEAGFSLVTSTLYIPALDAGELGKYRVHLKVSSLDPLQFQIDSVAEINAGATAISHLEGDVLFLPSVQVDEFSYSLQLRLIEGSSPITLELSAASITD